VSKLLNSTKGICAGAVFRSKTSGDFEVVSIVGKEILVKFSNTGYEKVTTLTAIIGGRLRDASLPRLICGVGINDADYVVKVSKKYKLPCGKTKSELVWQCPVYRAWKSMIERVHDKKYLSKRPTYLKVKITPEWYRFSNFRKWVMSLPYNTKGLSLDKDILSGEGQKIYSPDTCAFVSKVVNSYVLDFNTEDAKRVRQRTKNCWEARISNPFLKKDVKFYSSVPEDCISWVKDKRVEIIKRLIANELDSRIREALSIKYLKGEAQ
jgi:hypothetical protein